jgi:hypothetical protein
MDHCSKSGLPKVIGKASVAVGPAELASGVKSENTTPPASRTAHIESRLKAKTSLAGFKLLFMILFLRLNKHLWEPPNVPLTVSDCLVPSGDYFPKNAL